MHMLSLEDRQQYGHMMAADRKEGNKGYCGMSGSEAEGFASIYLWYEKYTKYLKYNTRYSVVIHKYTQDVV
jgi:hypothetical protein